MTTLKLLKEASQQPMICDKCGSNAVHLEFPTEKEKRKTYRVCDNCGERKNITGLPKTKFGIKY